MIINNDNNINFIVNKSKNNDLIKLLIILIIILIMVIMIHENR